eukprot:TRINITY_DN3154_c0_g1_i1.p1 TRINITY_DN3154_c0_g1~~TRINITY_DN3154_c0_g1_i1.p1  ORF type:complete len:197 (-),score=53.99 TRINITY_DN3154_c0_g1_i1:141-731(-)
MHRFLLSALTAAALLLQTSAFAVLAPSGRSLAARTPYVSSSSRAVAARPMCMMAKDADTVVIPPDFRLPAALVAIGGALAVSGNRAGLPVLGIGALLGLQATRVRFEFDAESMEVKIDAGKGDLADSGENFAVGGQNRWAYDTWTNWEVYPSEALPVLMYFKETQTSPEGQIHFFPFIMNPGQLLKEVRARVPIDK